MKGDSRRRCSGSWKLFQESVAPHASHTISWIPYDASTIHPSLDSAFDSASAGFAEPASRSHGRAAKWPQGLSLPFFVVSDELAIPQSRVTSSGGQAKQQRQQHPATWKPPEVQPPPLSLVLCHRKDQCGAGPSKELRKRKCSRELSDAAATVNRSLAGSCGRGSARSSFRRCEQC